MSTSSRNTGAGFSLENKKVWVAGHTGMVGSALLRRLEEENCQIITTSRKETDLRDQNQTRDFLAATKPDAVFLAAAKVGGIFANDAAPAQFLYDNLMISANVIDAAHRVGVEKLLYLGSTCVYPKYAPQPIAETSLLSGPLEPTNQWYAIAKIAGIKMCDAYRREYGCDFISAMPTNLYGPHDNFDLQTAHVLPALIAKMNKAKKERAQNVVLWGTGTPRREFLHVDDCADALIHMMKHFSAEGPLNVGSGTDLTIDDLAQLIAGIVEFNGDILFDSSKPDGTPRKLTDMSRLHALGWQAHMTLEDGIRDTYRWYLEHENAM